MSNAASTSRRPHAKVAAAGLGGAAATIILAILHACGLAIDSEAAAAITALATFACGYLKTA